MGRAQGRAMTGPCWSCDAETSLEYECEHAGHRWFCCDEVCGQTHRKLPPDSNGRLSVWWDHCHECQSIAAEQERERARHEPDPDMDDAGESGERMGMGRGA